MADEKARLIVDGDVSPLRQKLRDAARDIKQFGAEGKASIEGLGGPLVALQNKFVAIGAVLAGGAMFKQAVADAASFTEQSMKLGNALGISATEASKVINTLEDIGVTQDEFTGAAQRLAKQIGANESAIQAMGLATRDAAGNLRPLNDLMVDAVGVVNGYKAGADRAIAGQALFGRGFEITGNLARLNSEALRENTALQERLGVVVGEENVAAWNAYDQATDQADLTMKAAKNTVGNALIPVLTKLAEWFVSIGPAAITVLRGAIGGLIAAFWALKNGVVVVWEVINAMVVTVAEPLRTLSAALYKASTGDFKGAWAEFGKGGQTMVGAWRGALKEIEASSRESRDKIYNLFARGGAAKIPGLDGKAAGDLVKDDSKKSGKKGKPSGRMSDAEWAAEEAAHLTRTLYQIAEERAEAEEAAFKRATEAAEAWEEDLYRANDAVADYQRQSAEQRTQIEVLRAEAAMASELDRLDALEALASHEMDIGQTTQREYLARLTLFNAQRLAAEELFLARKRDIAARDPDQNVVELERLENEKAEIRRRYAAKGLELQRQAQAETLTVWRNLGERMAGLWDKGLSAILNGTLTWFNAWQAIGAEMVGWFIRDVIGEQVKAWILGHARMLAIKLGFIAQEQAASAAGSAAVVATKTAETTVVAGANAVQAGTGAAASQASIPIIGPMLALASMAAIFAAVSAMGGKVRSAARGFDIPRGLNPFTQLHEEEMVLPAKQANVIRNLAEGGQGTAAGGFSPTVNITAMDSRDVARALKEGGALHKALKDMDRRFIR